MAFKQGRSDWEIPMRPDHGQDLLDGLARNSMPGCPRIGRMRGLTLRLALIFRLCSGLRL